MTSLYPVIMCGGSGSRLWPASRPSRPKQFIPLAGNRSLFQEAVERVLPLVSDDAELIVVAGVGHRDAVVAQLEALDVSARILLEPEARDSAAAMAAAAAWTADRSPNGMNLFIAADHYIPDPEAFRAAVRMAVAEAETGRIVTLGVVPTRPSPAYGYIAPSGPGLAAVRTFVEKPDAGTAAEYIRDGYLWNSGNFITTAAVLLDELAQRAPGVRTAALRAVAGSVHTGNVTQLGGAFRDAPRVSIDYAVMETTDRASVLPVDFEWSDLGTWDSLHATGEGDVGAHLMEDADNCLVHACDGVMVAAVGVRDLAIVVERDAVLVTDLKRSQDVKKVVERLRHASPAHLDFPSVPLEGLCDGARRLATWLRQAALPTWATLGQAEDGGFEQVLSLDGRRLAMQRRTLVQARQIHVFAEAGRLGWAGPWRTSVERGLSRLTRSHLRSDGLGRTLLTPDGAPADETAMLHDQAFVMLALASAFRQSEDNALADRARAIRDRVLADGASQGGLMEAGRHPWQSNAHMRLLEACLTWRDVDDDGSWGLLADRIVALATSRFIDAEGGFLREFFQADWTPAPGPDGDLVEPGHQFEWAWLLARHARARGKSEMLEIARTLYGAGLRGVDPRRGIAMDALNADGSIRSRRGRLWPQAEWLRAALLLAQLSEGAARQMLLSDAAQAQRALWRYLTPNGLWRDKMLENGNFIDEPAPANSLYHIMAAYAQVQETLAALQPGESTAISLS